MGHRGRRSPAQRRLSVVAAGTGRRGLLPLEPWGPVSVTRGHGARAPGRRAARRRYLCAVPSTSPCLRHQPVDGRRGAGRPRPRRASVGGPAPDVPGARARRSSWSSRCPGCPTWCSPPTAARSSGAAPSAPASRTRSVATRRPAYLALAAATAGRSSRRSPSPDVNEGEGDFLVVGDLVLAGHGFRTDPGRTPRCRSCSASRSCRCRWSTPATTTSTRRWRSSTTGTAAVTSPTSRAPSAPGSREVLRRLFPAAVLVGPDEAAVLGLNAVSDGRHVVMSDRAPRFADGPAAARLRAGAARPVRAAQGRRRREVLHEGAARLRARVCPFGRVGGGCPGTLRE